MQYSNDRQNGQKMGKNRNLPKYRKKGIYPQK